MTGFKIIEGEHYFMPVHFGPRTRYWDGHYDDVTPLMAVVTKGSVLQGFALKLR